MVPVTHVKVLEEPKAAPPTAITPVPAGGGGYGVVVDRPAAAVTAPEGGYGVVGTATAPPITSAEGEYDASTMPNSASEATFGVIEEAYAASSGPSVIAGATAASLASTPTGPAEAYNLSGFEKHGGIDRKELNGDGLRALCVFICVQHVPCTHYFLFCLS